MSICEGDSTRKVDEDQVVDGVPEPDPDWLAWREEVERAWGWVRAARGEK
jgi:hypothetical protein